MRASNPDSFLGKVRGQISQSGEISRKELIEKLSVTDGKKLTNALAELTRRNYICRPEPGKYKWQGVMQESKLDAIWKYMRINTEFSVNKVSVFTGASMNHIWGYLKGLLEDKFVLEVGKAPFPGQREKVRIYQVAQEYKKQVQAPPYKREAK